MGTDIHGWVEVKRNEKYGWEAIIFISDFIHRNYDMFGCLFGVRNYAGFRPIAPDRGLPNDISWYVEKDYKEWYDDGAHSVTWITWKEIKSIDWEEEGESEDARVHVYIDGKYYYKFLWSNELTEEEWEKLSKQKKLVKGSTEYRLEKIKRREALTEDWELLFELMEFLAKKYGDENVRLVVWFDS